MPQFGSPKMARHLPQCVDVLQKAMRARWLGRIRRWSSATDNGVATMTTLARLEISHCLERYCQDKWLMAFAGRGLGYRLNGNVQDFGGHASPA